MNNNVVNLFEARREKESTAETKKDSESLSFKEIMERNKRNEERMRNERNRGNKSVLRSYRIKS